MLLRCLDSIDVNQLCFVDITGRKRLFAGTVPANKNLFAGTVPAN